MKKGRGARSTLLLANTKTDFLRGGEFKLVIRGGTSNTYLEGGEKFSNWRGGGILSLVIVPWRVRGKNETGGQLIVSFGCSVCSRKKAHGKEKGRDQRRRGKLGVTRKSLG